MAVLLKNYTPHVITLYRKAPHQELDADTVIFVAKILPEEVPARITMERVYGGEIPVHIPAVGGFIGDYVATFLEIPGKVEGLPKDEKGTYLIVSRLVAEALPWRSDLLYPSDLYRDVDGTILGCFNFGRVYDYKNSPNI